MNIKNYHIENDYRLNHISFNNDNNLNKKIYFLPTGKTGGCFLRDYLNFELEFWDPYLFKSNDENIETKINHIFNNITIISIRNPINKLLSSYNMIISKGITYIEEINQKKEYYQIIWKDFSKLKIQNNLIINLIKNNIKIYKKHDWEKYKEKYNIKDNFYSNTKINSFIHYLLVGKNNNFKISRINHKKNYNDLVDINFNKNYIKNIQNQSGFFSKYSDSFYYKSHLDSISKDKLYKSFNLFLDLLLINDKYDGHIWNQTETLKILYGLNTNEVLNKITHIIFNEELTKSCNDLSRKYNLKITEILPINEGDKNLKNIIKEFLDENIIQNKLKKILKDDIIFYNKCIKKYNKEYLIKDDKLLKNIIKNI